MKKNLFSAVLIFMGVFWAGWAQADPLPLANSAETFSQEDRELVDRFVKAGPPPCCDQPELYSEDVAAKPYLAPLLVDALKDASPVVQENQARIVFMLGRMGDPRAFQALIARHDPSKPESGRIRSMTGLGACVTTSTLGQYLDIAVNDPAVLSWLQTQAGSTCGADKACWMHFFSEGENLKHFQDSCRELSRPILG